MYIKQAYDIYDKAKKNDIINKWYMYWIKIKNTVYKHAFYHVILLLPSKSGNKAKAMIKYSNFQK